MKTATPRFMKTRLPSDLHFVVGLALAVAALVALIVSIRLTL